jgi:hypothetical protein
VAVVAAAVLGQGTHQPLLAAELAVVRVLETVCIFKPRV